MADIRDSDAPDARQLAEQGLRAAMIAPMIVGERVMGALCVGSEKPGGFNKRDESMLWTITSASRSGWRR